MGANFQGIVNQDRQALQNVLPLETPYSVFIDVCNACNFKCKFCAVQYAGNRRGYGAEMMSLDLFQKIMDDLTEFGQKIKILRLYGNGEPLLNKSFPDMLSYAKGKAGWIETVTNGSMLSHDLNRKLAAGCDRIRISIEGVDAEAYYSIAGVKLDWERFVDNIGDLYVHRGDCEIYIKTVDAAVESPEKKEKFLNTFGSICDKIYIENLSPIWPDYDELGDYFDLKNKAMMADSEVREIKVCPFPFYQIFIHSDGTVVPCCADWQKRLTLGNVNDSSLYQIWNSESYRTLWKDMLKNGRSCREVCSICSYPNSVANDNIDDYAEELLKKF